MAALMVARVARGRMRLPCDQTHRRTGRSHGSHHPIGVRPCDCATGANLDLKLQPFTCVEVVQLFNKHFNRSQTVLP